MTRFLTVLIICFITSACTPMIFLAGATSGVIIYDRRDLATRYADHKIRYAIKNRFEDDAELIEKTHIKVAVLDRIVLLVGEAPTSALRQRALNYAKQVPDIHVIYNEITIQPPISTKQRMYDAWLLTKTKSKLLASNGLTSTQIKIVTENCVVYLMGEVSHEEARQATQAVKTIQGVKKVVKLFEYI